MSLVAIPENFQTFKVISINLLFAWTSVSIFSLLFSVSFGIGKENFLKNQELF